MVDLLTGGFPCQPFSHAGKRRSRNDNRYLWPEMLEVIQLTKPRWVIAENVHGILSIEQGMVFESCCSDLEKEGYEVRAFIVPACAVNAPHRRDRVWIVAKNSDIGRRSGKEGLGKCDMRGIEGKEQDNNAFKADKGYNASIPRNIRNRPIRENDSRDDGCQGIRAEEDVSSREEISLAKNIEENRSIAPIPASKGLEREIHKEGQGSRFNRNAVNATSKRLCRGSKNKDRQQPEMYWAGLQPDWGKDWREVAAATCIRGVDDGIPDGMDNISEAKHRTERLKMLGNSIVPQVAMEIMRAINLIGKG